MTPKRQRLVTILALMTPVPELGGDAYSITQSQLQQVCLLPDDLLNNLPASIYDGEDHGRHVFMRSGLENHLGISKARAETLERGMAGGIER